MLQRIKYHVHGEDPQDAPLYDCCPRCEGSGETEDGERCTYCDECEPEPKCEPEPTTQNNLDRDAWLGEAEMFHR